MTDPVSDVREAKGRFRIWALSCPFRKDGTPSLGSFGSTIRNVVIVPVETWTTLCQENPALAATKFEVGAYEDD